MTAIEKMPVTGSNSTCPHLLYFTKAPVATRTVGTTLFIVCNITQGHTLFVMRYISTNKIDHTTITKHPDISVPNLEDVIKYSLPKKTI